MSTDGASHDSGAAFPIDVIVVGDPQANERLVGSLETAGVRCVSSASAARLRVDSGRQRLLGIECEGADGAAIALDAAQVVLPAESDLTDRLLADNPPERLPNLHLVNPDDEPGELTTRLVAALREHSPGCPSVSVVIPTCNRRENLRRVLAPVLADPAATEVIVVSDGSTDGTDTELALIAAEYPQVVPLILAERGGVANARSRGYAQATQDIVLTLDDDVLVDPGTVSAHGRAHADSADHIVVGYMPTASPEGRARNGHFATALYAREYENMCAMWEADPDRVLLDFWMGNVSFPRHLATRLVPPAGAPRDAYHEDRFVGLSLRRAGVRAEFRRNLRAHHLHDRTIDQAEFQYRRQGRDLAVLHAMFADELGPLDLDEISASKLSRPVAWLVKATDRPWVYAATWRTVDSLLRLAARARCFSAEVRIGQLMRRIELRRGAAAALAEGPLAKPATTNPGTFGPRTASMPPVGTRR